MFKRTPGIGFAVIAAALIITFLLFLNSQSVPLSSQPFFYVLARLAALLGITSLCFVFMLSSRHPVLEDLFGGLDRIYRLHHLAGTLTFSLLVLHPLSLAVDLFPDPLSPGIFFIPGQILSYDLGIFAFYLLFILLFITLYIRLRYHHWKSTHRFMGVVLLLAGLHSTFIGSDIAVYLPLRLWILFLVGLGLSAYIFREFIYKFTPVYNYRVKSVTPRGQVTEISLTPESVPLPFLPGQFSFVSFPGLPGLSEPHPFSVASPAKSPLIRFFIKNIGDFTADIHKVRPGNKAVLSLPYGRFFNGFSKYQEIICIAGGIGITPFLGLLKSRLRPGKTTHLFYSASDQKEAILHQELQQISSEEKFKYHLHLTNTSGRLTAENILKSSGSVVNKPPGIYICGPSKMMHALSAQFRDLGIPRSHIFFEDFYIR